MALRLIKWSTPEGAFEAWKACTRGRPCDYTGLSYQKLSGADGISWPCNQTHPNGERWPYKDLIFPTDVEYCESFGHDLITGAATSPEKYRANNPAGRAILKPAEYIPPSEEPDKEYAYLLTTGRLVHHFHTRTKTGRAKELQAAAPDEAIQIAAEDASKLGLKEGDWIRITSRRGSIEAQAAIGDIETGHVFIPFHFGYWDNPGRARAVNELTLYEWDAVSKQPHFKYAAVKLKKVSKPSLSQPESVDLHPEKHLASSVGSMAEQVGELAKDVITGIEKKLQPERAHIADYIGLLDESEKRLVKAFRQIRSSHPDEPDIGPLCKLFGDWSKETDSLLSPLLFSTVSGAKASPRGLIRRSL